jgi:hypothetical protein
MPAALSMFGLEWAISDKGREVLHPYRSGIMMRQRGTAIERRGSKSWILSSRRKLP